MADKTLAKQFGMLVRSLRLEKGLSQEDFAEACGLHRTYIGAIERGEKTVTIETASKLSNAMQISLADLFKRLEQLQKADV